MRIPPPRPFRVRSIALASLLTLAPVLGAQTAPLPDAPQPAVTIRSAPGDILHDQAAIWTNPTRIRTRDLEWLAPLALATGAAIANDHRAMSKLVSHDAGFNNANVNTSNVMIGGFIAAPVAFYGYGHFHQSPHARETGILSGEAMIDGVVVEQGMKLIFWRERPALDSARGRFFQSSAGIDSAFPSSHSVIAWAAASSIAAEYPRPLAQILVYSAATGVSLTRVLGQQHFPSDVLAGSAAGWLIGHYVVHHHRQHHHSALRP